MSRKILISGTGLLTPLGVGTETNWARLLRGDVWCNEGKVPLESDSNARVTQLGSRAAREAIDQAHWSDKTLSDDRTALVIGTSKGPIEEWLNPLAPLRTLFGVSATASEIGQLLKMGNGPRLTLSAACASGLHAIVHAMQLIRQHRIDRAIVVGTESSLHPVFGATFKRLGVLAKPQVGCRPFDRDRTGFLMSEAAAAICVEATDATRGLFLTAGGMGGDATHLTGADPDGHQLRRLIQTVARGETYDFIHAHGTGTETNDPVELAAIEATVGGAHLPSIYSHKAAIGHTQGSAGVISIVINCLIHEHAQIPPNPNTTKPLPYNTVRIEQESHKREVRRSLALAAGFGGAMGVVGIRKM